MVTPTRRYVQVASATHSVLTVVSKWFIGVLFSKLFSASTAITSNTEGGGFEGVSEATNPLLPVALLNELSFRTVLICASATIIANTFAASVMASMAVLVAAQNGRKLRADVLQRAAGNNSRTACNETFNNHAVDNISNYIKDIENFQSYDEHWLLFNWLRLGLCISLSFVFAWYSGVIVLGLVAVSEASAYVFAQWRTPLRDRIDKNSETVVARLLDVIKNADMIQMMATAKQEEIELAELESKSDVDLVRDAKIRCLQNTVKVAFSAFIAVIIASVAWPIVQGADPADALTTGAAVLVTMFLLEEGHKSLIYLAFVSDKKAGAVNAQRKVNEFLGVSLLIPEAGNLGRHNATQDDLVIESAKESSLGATGGFRRMSVARSKEVVALEDIVLQYPGRDHPALDRYCQAFEGEKIHGITGESGCGKSTRLKVIAALLKPQGGTIKLREGCSIAYVSQEQKLFARTVRENVTYGSNTPVTDEELWEALDMAVIGDFVRSLPNSLDKNLDGGEHTVSGGQLQRLHLAHLFCACQDAGIVILDECLSALDERSRDLLIERLREFLKGKTSFVVTHHSEMLRICDVIHDCTPKTLIRPDAKPLPKFRHRYTQV